MRALMIVCTVLGLLAVKDLRSDDRMQGNADVVQATLDRLAEMDAREQQEWLLRFEERAIRAAQQTLGPSEAAQREAQIRAMLHQQLITWPVLSELLADTIRLEAQLAQPEPAAKADKPVERPEVKKPHTVHKPVTPQPSASGGETPSSKDVQVNVDELAARVAGSNLGIRTLENELDEKGTWDAARLEPLADRLKILVIRYGDLSLFRDLVPKDKRSAVGRLVQPRSAISSLGARIFEARQLAESHEYSGTAAERQAELRRLDDLSRQLAELADGKTN